MAYFTHGTKARFRAAFAHNQGLDVDQGRQILIGSISVPNTHTIGHASQEVIACHVSRCTMAIEGADNHELQD